jgi:hypothetical protein
MKAATKDISMQRVCVCDGVEIAMFVSCLSCTRGKWGSLRSRRE